MQRFILLFSWLFISSSALAQSAAEHLAAGDRDYVAMNATSALSHYEAAIKLDASSYDANWKASRSAIDIGSYTNDKSRREALYSSAEQYARKAVALKPGEPEGHFELARALGKTALSQSPKARIKYATEIRSQALECLRIDPKHGGCLHVMGMWNAEVMRLNGLTRMVAKNFLGGKVFGTASWKEAIRYMEASVANDPERIVHYVDLAEIYDDLGENSKARAMYEAALRLPETDVNDKQYKAQARQGLGSK
jgi:tetratricopeptide (TPR) repeat protein